METLLEASATITGSKIFKKVLEVLLTFGNFLNQGSFRGNAQGVKINYLNELRNTKASSSESGIKTYTMLHYLNEFLSKEGAPVSEDNEPLDNWHGEMAILHDALKIDPEQLTRDLEMLQQGLGGVKGQLKLFLEQPEEKKVFVMEDGDEVDDEFGDIMEKFVETAERDVLSATAAESEGGGKSAGELCTTLDTVQESLNKLVCAAHTTDAPTRG
jgi:hypothetical protein